MLALARLHETPNFLDISEERGSGGEGDRRQIFSLPLSVNNSISAEGEMT